MHETGLNKLRRGSPYPSLARPSSGARSRFRGALSFCVLVYAGLTAVAAAAETESAFVLDRAGRSVARLDLATGEVLKTVRLQGDPETMRMSPDGARLIVLDRGPGKDKGERGYQAKGKSTATLIDIDATSLEIVSRVELGWGLYGQPVPFALIDDEGKRLTVICPGYDSKKPRERLARELVTVDLASGEVIGRVTLERRVQRAVAYNNGQAVALFSAREKRKRATPLPARLVFIDLDGPLQAGTLDLDGTPGPPTLSPDGGFVYLLEHGRPSKKPKKNVDGRIQAVSLATRTIEANLDAGRKPRGLIVDDVGGQVFVLSDDPPGGQKEGRYGELRVIRGAETVALLRVAKDPFFLRTPPAREQAYVVSEKAVTSLDLPALQVLSTIPLEDAGRGANELAFGPQAERGFVLYGRSSKLAILDLEANSVLTTVKTGRGSKKVLKALAQGVASAGAQGNVGPISFSLSIPYSVASANTSLVVGPDGKFVYALNPETSDVTIVNAVTGALVSKVGGGGHEIKLLTGGTKIVTVSSSKLHIFDTKSNTKVDELKLKGLREFSLSSDGRHAVALAQGTVLCMDGASGSVMARVTAFRDPIEVLFDRSPLPAADSSEEPAEPKP